MKELKKLYPKTQAFLHADSDWEFLFAVILSAQTTDKKVNEVTAVLFKKFVFDDYLTATEEELAKEINQIGLYKSKARYLLKTAKILDEKYGRKVPGTFEDLLALPGVGRKTANVILSEIHGKEEGIIVDTHVIRLSQKFGLTKHTTADKIEKDLLPLVPEGRRLWFANALIAYGREHSPARLKEKTDLISVKIFKN